MSDRIIGTCSICGGTVMAPAAWFGVHPPTPTCVRCHATAAPPSGPVIPMVPAPVPHPFVHTITTDRTDDPNRCTYCGQPRNSAACQRLHP